jgi:4-hydroxy-tetrahydrodipicolinate synthase
MTTQSKFSGVLVPVATPFTATLTPDHAAFARHCRWLLDRGVDGLAVFGTTSEANSLAIEERVDMLDALIDAGVAPAMLMPGTGTCALTDTVRLTAQAVERGCGGVLMLPPFYYKDVSDEGLFAYYSEVIQRVGDGRLRVYLYHIPPIAREGISAALIERLVEAFPDIVMGIKDSSGDWRNTAAILDRFPGFATFSGSESHLLATLRGGGAGCITATGNINPAGIRELCKHWRGADADRIQQRVTAIRSVVEAFPLIGATKAMIADHYGDESWLRVRPPLMPLPESQLAALRSALSALEFSMGRGGV